MKKDLGKKVMNKGAGFILAAFACLSMFGVGFAMWSNGVGGSGVSEPISVSVNLANTYSIIDLDTTTEISGYKPFVVCKDGYVTDETISTTGTLIYYFRYNAVAARPTYQWSDQTTHFDVSLSLKNAYQFETSDSVLDTVVVSGLTNNDSSGFSYNGAHEIESKLSFENKTTTPDGQLFSISYTFNANMLNKIKDSSGNLISSNMPKFYLRLSAVKEST